MSSLRSGRSRGSGGATRRPFRPPRSALLATGHRPEAFYQGFLGIFIREARGDAPVLTLLASAGFFAFAAVRRAPRALDALSGSLGAMAVVAPGTLERFGLISPHLEPLFAVAALQLGSV